MPPSDFQRENWDKLKAIARYIIRTGTEEVDGELKTFDPESDQSLVVASAAVVWSSARVAMAMIASLAGGRVVDGPVYLLKELLSHRPPRKCLDVVPDDMGHCTYLVLAFEEL
jgi:hypothetical protein